MPWNRLLYARPELLLPFRPFRAVFLNDVGVGDRACEVGFETQFALEALVRQTKLTQRRFNLAEELPERGLYVRLGVVHDDIQAVSEEERRPGAADDACADDGYVSHAVENGRTAFRRILHSVLPSSRLPAGWTPGQLFLSSWRPVPAGTSCPLYPSVTEGPFGNRWRLASATVKLGRRRTPRPRRRFRHTRLSAAGWPPAEFVPN